MRPWALLSICTGTIGFLFCWFVDFNTGEVELNFKKVLLPGPLQNQQAQEPSQEDVAETWKRHGFFGNDMVSFIGQPHWQHWATQKPCSTTEGWEHQSTMTPDANTKTLITLNHTKCITLLLTSFNALFAAAGIIAAPLKIRMTRKTNKLRIRLTGWRIFFCQCTMSVFP